MKPRTHLQHSFERADRLACQWVPKPDCLVATTRSERCPVRTESNSRHFRLVPSKRVNRFAAADIPDLDRVIVASRRDGLTARGEGDSADQTYMTFEGLQQLTALRIP